MRGIDALSLRRAQIDTNELVALTVLRDRVTRERHGEETRDILRCQSELTSLDLIDLERERALGRFVPIELDVPCPRVRAHRRGDFLGDRAHGADVVAAHAKLNRKADGRAVFEPRQTRAYGWELVRERRIQPARELVAVCDAFRRDDELREVRLLKLLV